MTAAGVTAVTTSSGAAETYANESVSNDKTYLDSMAEKEKTYLTEVTEANHSFNTDDIDAAGRDALIAAAWQTYQNDVTLLRQNFKVDQTADNATLRTDVGTANSTRVDAVADAREGYTQQVEDTRHDATEAGLHDWVAKISQIVMLNATTSNGLATSLATSIRGLAGQSSGSSGAGAFWSALADKADLAADYVQSLNKAKTDYLVGKNVVHSEFFFDGQTIQQIDSVVHTPGMLEHQAEFQINVSEALRDYNVEVTAAQNVRDRSEATAYSTLATDQNAAAQGQLGQSTRVPTISDPAKGQGKSSSSGNTAAKLSELLTGGTVAPGQLTPQADETKGAGSGTSTSTTASDEDPAPVEPPELWSPPSLQQLDPGLYSSTLGVIDSKAAHLLPPKPVEPTSPIGVDFVLADGLDHDPPSTHAEELADALRELDAARADLAARLEARIEAENWRYRQTPIAAAVEDKAGYFIGVVNGFAVDGLWGDIDTLNSLAKLQENIIGYGITAAIRIQGAAISGAVQGLYDLGLDRLWNPLAVGEAAIAGSTNAVSNEFQPDAEAMLEAAARLGEFLKLMNAAHKAVQGVAGETALYYTGNIDEFSPKTQLATIYLYTALASAAAEATDLSSEDVGRLVGMVLWEIALGLATEGVATELKVGKHVGQAVDDALALLVKRLGDAGDAKGVKFLQSLAGNPRFANAIKKIAAMLAGISDETADAGRFIDEIGKFGCFTADTPVLITTSTLREQDSSHAKRIHGSAAVLTDVSETSVAIQDVQLGQRISTENPKPDEIEYAAANDGCVGWKTVSMEVRHASGAVVDVELMRSPNWIERNRLQVGKWFSFELTEIEVEGRGFVRSIVDAPDVPPGPGAVVTGRFTTRLAADLVCLTLEDGTQLSGTRKHPVWAPDEGDWRGLGDFQAGQCVLTRDGLRVVVSVESLPDAAPVYNIEVAGQHVYQVTELGILVHNAGGWDCNDFLDLRDKLLNGKLTKAELKRYLDYKEGLKYFQQYMDPDDLAYFNKLRPEEMDRAHLHHILQKLARNTDLARDILEVQKKLLGIGIDPIIGREILVYAPNITGQHGYDAMRPIIDRLNDAFRNRWGKKRIVALLKELGEEAAGK